MDPLTEMHLLLREAGWTPEYRIEEGYYESWRWSHTGHKRTILTFWNDPDRTQATWGDTTEVVKRNQWSHSVDELRQRLKELAQQSPV